MQQKAICVFFFVMWIFAIFMSPMAVAENRALLIGVGQYKHHPNNNLPGIDKDIQMMKKVVGMMGFKGSQVETLMDSQATLRGIEDAIENWLIKGATRESDRVFFYFSGHGSQVKDVNGDETDGVDETLVTHDTLDSTNMFLDDKFGEMLSRINSREIFVLIDACHSGTATKNAALSKGDISKFFYYKGITRVKSSFAPERIAKENYVCLSACQDDETSLASSDGSYFTRGLLDTIEKSRKNGTFTMNQLKDRATVYVGQNASEIYHPKISGNKDLANKPIAVEELDQWAELERLADEASYKVKVWANQEKFKIGQLLEISCDVDREGYLNILCISPGDEKADVLYPNRFHPENRVTKGKNICIPAKKDDFVLRSKKDDFVLRCRPPVGRALIVVFHTEKEINAYKDGLGDMDALFMQLSEKSLNTFKGAFEVQARQTESKLKIGAGKIITYVEE